MPAAWSHHATAAATAPAAAAAKKNRKDTSSQNSEWTLGSLLAKFGHGFVTQLGAVFLWREVRHYTGRRLAAWSHQATAAGSKKEAETYNIFPGSEKGSWAFFLAKFGDGFGTQ